MPVRSSRVALLAVLLVSGAGAGRAEAGDGGLKVVSGTIQSAPADPLGLARTLACNLSPLGQFPGELVFTSFGADGSFTAAVTLRPAGGTIVGEISGRFVSPTEILEVFRITGGTRKFKNASGLIALGGTIDPVTGLGEDRVLAGYIYIP